MQPYLNIWGKLKISRKHFGREESSLQEKKKIKEQIAVEPIMDQPETAEEMIDKYGTYNIQPTADSGNEFPAIAAGLANHPQKRMKKPPETQR